MPAPSSPRPDLGWRPSQVVERKLSAVEPLAPHETALLQSLNAVETFQPGQRLREAGAARSRPRFVVVGWAARVRMLADGRRQILSLLLPGDDTGLVAGSPLADAQTVALTSVRTIDASPLADFLAAPGSADTALGRACARARSQEQAQLLDQVTRLGRMTAVERAENMFLELHDRLETVGLAGGGAFPLPVTQEVLADMLGLSLVHVNRVLQHLRREGMVELRSGRARLLRYGGPAAAPARLAAGTG